MRKLFLSIIAFLSIAIPSIGQEAMEEKARLEVSVEFPSGIEVESAAQTLQNNIMQALVLNGLSATESRFTTLVRVSTLSKNVTSTAPAMFVTELEISLFIGDLFTGTLFGQSSFEVKGIGETEAKSYIDAIRKVQARNPKLRTMITKSKDKIMSYFDAQGDQILTRIDAHIARKDYRSALIEIYSIPKACSDLYNSASAKLSLIPMSEQSRAQINFTEINSYYYSEPRSERVKKFINR